MWSDQRLLARAHRNPDAFGELYERHAATIHRAIERHVGSREAALDLTAETFARAFASAGSFRPRGRGDVAPWLHGIAINVVRESRRGQRLAIEARMRLGIVEATTFADVSEIVWERVDADALSEHLASALRELPDAQRSAIEQRVLGGRSFAEVARAGGCSEQAARVRVFRGLRAMRVRMERRG